MKLEVVFKGKPSEFGIAAEVYSLRAPRTDDGGRLCFLNHQGPLDPDTNPVRVFLRSQKSNIVDTVIRAHSIPNGNALLVLDSTEDKWAELESSWNLLLDELTKQGWIEPKRKRKKVMDQEKEIERLWRKGLTDQEIAGRLAIGARTVRRYRERLGLNMK